MSAYPGNTNTWIPSWDATGQVIGFVRDPKRFAINRYVAFRPATKMVGVYLALQSKDFVRVVTDDEYVWPDGGERPSGNENLVGFDFTEYRTIRRDYPVTLGNLTVGQADWPIKAVHSQEVMSQAMTSLTRRTLGVLENTANWPATNFGTATAVGGGLWLASSVANKFIRKTFNAVIRAVKLQTNGRVEAKDMQCVLGDDIAKAIAETDELQDTLKQSVYAMAQARGDSPDALNAEYGLPNKLYGVDLVVESATVEPTRRGATSALAFVKDQNKAIFLTKKDGVSGDVVGEEGNTFPNVSTYQVFYYGEGGTKTDEKSGYLLVEEWNDVRNKRQEIHVVQNTCEKLVAGGSGYLITNVLS